jgi:FixJ family two-component response regulator
VPTRNRTIVVVDDDDGMANALRRMLTAAGFEAEVFGSAEAMLDARAADHAACMVLDVQLPGMSGFELFDRIAAEDGPPVIFITAYDDEESRAEAERRHAHAFLVKPFTGRALVVEIVRALAPRSLQPVPGGA